MMPAIPTVCRRAATALQSKLRGLARDERGVSAVEFAMLLPLMITLYLGTVELSQGIAADRKVTLTARTISDLVSQVSSINNSGMTNALNASAAVMTPYPTANLKVTVSSVKIDGQGKATIDWSDTMNGTARAKNASVAIPPALAVPNSTLIWSEVSYTYKPVIGYVLTGSLNLKDEIFMRPRLSAEVMRSSS
jgi:Flp pilus assembly protein TadG